ncbi:hemerythrin domain-containing protein [Calidifontimicrobium sp. SYSU G02091]|uniref:hemerythrin domain-containing protein n=1 Tax=Calidifontimicrobium sp. SYSU G02091 TaxID=2926421 RepID=UPI001F537E4E|nr:hemerythrin domain-containing protein [Calidifontimicrobium sp. SYSU G02091]MCI1191433.1 hemerythrin domain-containing protein [Calidifontimicrobium sp. SYSU G02091]
MNDRMHDARSGALHAAPAAGFEQPFEMLHACHERVQRMLALLLRLGEHLQRHGADAQAADAARSVMRYFDVAGPAHHADEELHVLPWLRAHGRQALAQRLHADHEAMAEQWRAVRAALEPVAAGRWTGDAATLAGWHAFAQGYAEHIAVEETQAYPPVAAALDASTLDAMGREMAAHRRHAT